MAELVWKGKHNTHEYHLLEAQKAACCARLSNKNYYAPDDQLENPPFPPETWFNRLIRGDNKQLLPVLRSEFAEQVNLIYIDPPFMTGRTFGNGVDIAYRDTWNNNLDNYLQWLYEGLQHLYALLSPNGSLYLHLDWRTTHYAKILLDEIFGSHPSGQGPGFRNEIIWHYQSGGRSHHAYARKHDTILLYTKSEHYCFHSERIAERRGTQKRNHMRKEIGEDGRISWTIRSAGRLYTYHEDSPMSQADVWSDISHLHQKDPERTGYATQKPEALLERIILASSEAQDLVLDCFCGSGVTAVVAEQLGRRWITSDKSDVAVAATRERLLKRVRTQPFVLQHCDDSARDDSQRHLRKADLPDGPVRARDS